MKKLFLFFAVTILSFTTCTKDLKNIKVENQEMTDMAGAVNYTIPIEEAIEELYSTLDFIESERMFAAPSQSASQGKRREIDKISVIYGNVAVHPQNNSSTADKQTFATTQKDSLLYIIDFKNNAGSAVLAADSRIPDPVLVITEQGSLKDTNNNMYPPEYKQGMYADSELMKGFSLYNAELDDYYVAGRPRILDYCEQYASFYLTKFQEEEASPHNPKVELIYTKIGDWAISEKITPMLTTKWNQGSPFNDAAPLKNWFFWQKWEKKCPAGCVPIAMAQIMAYHEFPKNYECEGYIVNWKEVKKISINNNSVSNYDKEAIAKFVYRLGEWSGAIFTPDWTFTFPGRAKSTMETLGYKNMSLHKSWSSWENSHGNLIIDMLRADNPVFIASIAKVASGHAWVIDGYIDRSRQIERKFRSERKEWIRTTSETQQLVHCNWGWGGKDNGYYAVGIFHARIKKVEESDYFSKYTTKNKEKDNYNWAFHIFTYDNPNK